jgi:hypothetical protein
MREALVSGLRAAWRARGLALLLLFTNAALAAVLAAPLAASIESDVANRGSAPRLVAGFDYDWWARWNAEQRGQEKAFGPEIAGAGFAFRNVDMLLRGDLPGGLFRFRSEKPVAGALPGVLALGAVYFVLQALLAGGILATLRAARGGFTFRAFAHACGHYAGPLLRVTALALVADALVFLLHAAVAGAVEARAHDAADERTALLIQLSRHALLLLALVFVHLVSGYAKAIVVLEERRSALLAFLSAKAFVLRNAAAVLGHFAAVLCLGVAVIAAFVATDAALPVTGYRTQLLALLLMQLVVLLRIGLRLALAGGQLALLQRAR